MSYCHKLFLALLLISGGSAHANGIVMGATRVIFNQSAKEAAITVENRNNSDSYLIQSWMEDAKGQRVTPLTVTPPLFRMAPKKENMLRIIETKGGMPTDRESVYWLNVKAIPPSAEQKQNTLQIAIKTRMKVFYRPKDLPGSALQAQQGLTWQINGRQLIVSNNSAYYVTLGVVKLNGKEIKNVDLIAPRQSATFDLSSSESKGAKVTWTAINDFGGVSEIYSTVVI